MTKKEFLDILKSEMVPAMGCTEPAACALAGARARELYVANINEDPCEDPLLYLAIYVSKNMVKNTLGVSIPGCDKKGVEAAAAIGVAIGNTSKGLNLLSTATDEHFAKASQYRIQLHILDDVPPLYVSVHYKTVRHEVIASVANEHDNFVLEAVDKLVLKNTPIKYVNGSSGVLKNLTLKEIVTLAEECTEEDLEFIENAYLTNLAICEEGLCNDYGLSVGKNTCQPIFASDSGVRAWMRMAASITAAGSDARMSGCQLPVIINSGSGNQGIIVTVPVMVIANALAVDVEKSYRAICISEMIGLVLTAKKDRLSALCGAFTASIGTAVAWCYLMNGTLEQMDMCIQNMIANLSGIICDGAKCTCALKIHSCLEAAATAVTLAMENKAPREVGIAKQSSEESIEALSRLSHEGMVVTDKTILDIMMNQQC